MSNKTRQVNKYLLDYLKKTIPDFQKKGKLFTCPQKHLHPEGTEELTANEFPEFSGKLYCFCPSCGNVGSFVDLYRKFSLDNNPDIPNEEVVDLIIDEFGIKINEEQEKLFDLYEKLGFDMVPVNKNGKEAFIEKDWQNKSHKNRAEWEQWINSSKLNMGIKTGKLSNVLILDFDFVDSELKKRIYAGNPTEKMLEDARKQWEDGLQMIKEKIPSLDFTTLQQNSFGGIHLFYIFDEEIPKTAFDYEGIHIDIEAEAGQVVCEPSLVGGQNRQIVGDKINLLPKELKEFIIQNCQKSPVSNKKEIKPEEIGGCELTFENLNSNRNNTFCKLYGMMRQDSPIDVATRHLKHFNNLMDKKLPLKEILAMAKQAEKYHKIDCKAVADRILEYFGIVKDTLHFRDLKDYLRLERKDIEEALRYLQDERKIIKIKKDIYQLIADVEWKTDFVTLSKPLDMFVPYVGDYAVFNRGSMLVLSGKTGAGKTTWTVNFIEQFVRQGIKVKLITTEADSGVGEIALARGLKEGDFLYYQTSDPLTVPFQKDEVRIIDWITPTDNDYTKIGLIYKQLNDKLVDHGGLLIALSQLKDNGEFFAPNQISQYASLAGKFLYPEKNGQVDHLHPYLEICKMRRPKTNQKFIQIPMEYNFETKELRIKK